MILHDTYMYVIITLVIAIFPVTIAQTRNYKRRDALRAVRPKIPKIPIKKPIKNIEFMLNKCGKNNEKTGKNNEYFNPKFQKTVTFRNL